jgi:hypothetical protein
MPDLGPGDAGQPGDAEVERLRAEVAALRARGSPPRPRHRISWRGPVASVLVVLGCVLAPLSVIAVWASNQVSNTDRYVANVAPLISDPAIQVALTDKISTQIDAKLQLQKRANEAADVLSKKGLTTVGTLLHSVSGTLAGAIEGFIHTEVGKVVASPQVARLWTQVNQTAHAQLVSALSGQGGSAISTSNGEVTLSLGPFIDQAKKDLSAKGLTLVDKIPPVNPTFTLFSSTKLAQAQTAYRLINTVGFWLPIIALVLIGLGVYVARGHRRTLLWAAVGVAISMVVLAIALQVFRSIYLGSVPNSKLPGTAAAALFDTLVRFIADGLWAVFVVALVVAVAAFFAGPSVTAVRTRSGLRAGLGWLRETGERRGLSTGPVGPWTYRYRIALRVGAAAIAVLVLVFWGQPTGIVALIIAVILLAVVGLIELIGRPPARRHVAAHH